MMFYVRRITRTQICISICSALGLRKLKAGPDHHFSLFKAKYEKSYATREEHDYRFSVFKVNLRRAKRHQKLDPSAVHGVTKYSDLTPAEFRKNFLGLKRRFKLSSYAQKAPILPTNDLSEDFDWRDKGAVTGVKDQVVVEFSVEFSDQKCLLNSHTSTTQGVLFYDNRLITAQTPLLACHHDCHRRNTTASRHCRRHHRFTMWASATSGGLQFMRSPSSLLTRFRALVLMDNVADKFRALSIRDNTANRSSSSSAFAHSRTSGGRGRGLDERDNQERSRGRGGRGSGKNKIDALGRLMTRILRHMASELSLSMRSDGYVRVQDLLKLNMKTFADIPLRAHTIDDIREAVRRDNKQRFSLLEENGELLIRANQGHSITTVETESLLTPILSAEEVPVCVHGTYKKFLPSILDQGLKRMERLHVHFSCGLPTDGKVISGIRGNINVLIFLDVRKALEEGIKLYISDNKVILTEGFDGVVPVKYFEKIESWPDRRPIPF